MEYPDLFALCSRAFQSFDKDNTGHIPSKVSIKNLPTTKKLYSFIAWVMCYREMNGVKNQSIDGNNLLAHCTISSFYNQRSWLLSWGRWVRILQTVKSTIWLTRWNFIHFFKINLSKCFLNISHSKPFFGQVDVDGSGLIEFHEFVKFIVRSHFLFSTKS